MKTFKKYVLYGFPLLILLLIFSCSEDFLDKRPYGIQSENFFTNEKGIDALLTGAYGRVRNKPEVL